MSRLPVCKLDHPGVLARAGAPYTEEQCWLCWLFLNDRKYNKHWGGDGNVTPPPLQVPQHLTVISRPCVHLGDYTGDRETCGTCPGNVRIKLYACAVHGKASLVKKLGDTACCATCPSYDPKSK